MKRQVSKKSSSDQSNTTISTDGGPKSNQSVSTSSTGGDTKRSSSEFNSRNVSNSSNDSGERSQFFNLSQRPNNLRRFTYTELKNATRNFSRALMIGEGGFGCVYRGSFRNTLDGSNSKVDIAVKQLNRKGLQGHKEWLAEVSVLGVVEHPNLVKLVGCCIDDDERGPQRLLVYEYMPNRSVDDHLSNRMNASLSWDMRLRIALDAARGLTYLHEGMDFQIIFRDMKTSNILLDEKWNAKLSDFGLAREGPTEGLTHISTAVVGTIGYAAPEYILTGRLTSKIDVWSYGVVLYELITGRRPIDRNRPSAEQKLLEWIKPYMADAKKFPSIIDPRLQDNCSINSVMKLAAVANMCLTKKPKLRPKMSEVLELVQEIVENIEIGSPSFPRNVNYENEEENSHDCCKKKGIGLKERIGNMKNSWSLWTPKAVKSVQV